MLDGQPQLVDRLGYNQVDGVVGKGQVGGDG